MAWLGAGRYGDAKAMQGPVQKQKRRRGRSGVEFFGNFGDALDVMGGEGPKNLTTAAIGDGLPISLAARGSWPAQFLERLRVLGCVNLRPDGAYVC